MLVDGIKFDNHFFVNLFFRFWFSQIMPVIREYTNNKFSNILRGDFKVITELLLHP